jgi:NTP pyrophosphatase (non-canonical NTP hydrolase)
METKYAPTHASSPETKMGYLIEECGEVLQAAGKTLRWGADSVNPELPRKAQVKNRDWLKSELSDLKYAIGLIEGIL